MLWLKYDLDSRYQYLSELITCIDMSFIPPSYSKKNIKNEEILQSDFKSNDYFPFDTPHFNTFDDIGFLYDTLKMYGIKDSNMYSNLYSNRRYRTKDNQVILVFNQFFNDTNTLFYCITGLNVPIPNLHYFSCRYSIILQDGRIFELQTTTNGLSFKFKLYDGNNKQWNSSAEHRNSSNWFFSFYNLKQLDDQIYIMSDRGYFYCFIIEQNKWTNLKRITERSLEFQRNGLVVLDNIIFYVCNEGVYQYNSKNDTWLLVSHPKHLGIHFATCFLNGFLYVLGGEVNQSINIALNSAHKFNPATKIWSRIANMNKQRKEAGVVTVHGLIHIMGGDYCSSYEIYNPENDTWTQSSITFEPTPHRFGTSTRAVVIPKSNINPENLLDYYSASAVNCDDNGWWTTFKKLFECIKISPHGAK